MILILPHPLEGQNFLKRFGTWTGVIHTLSNLNPSVRWFKLNNWYIGQLNTKLQLVPIMKLSSVTENEGGTMVPLSSSSFFALMCTTGAAWMSQEVHPFSDMISVTLQSNANPLHENRAITYNHHIRNFYWFGGLYIYTHTALSNSQDIEWKCHGAFTNSLVCSVPYETLKSIPKRYSRRKTKPREVKTYSLATWLAQVSRRSPVEEGSSYYMCTSDWLNWCKQAWVDYLS